jgi:drug/metabolite transporter (DMT)-like permease
MSGYHAPLLLACVIWAVSFIATKIALETTPPVTVVAIRLVMAALCFLPVVVRRRRVIFTGGWRRFGQLLLLSLFGTGLHYGTQTVGINYTTASNASLWAMTCPVSIALISFFFLGERISLRKIGGIALAAAGVLVVLGPGFFQGLDLRSHLLGDGLVFMSITLWAFFTVYGKRLNAEMGAFELVGIATLIGAIWTLPAGLWEMKLAGFSLLRVTPKAWIAIGFLGAGCSFLATLLYFTALEKTGTQKVGVYLYTVPPMTYAAAALVLNEHIGMNLLAGSVVVGLGVYLTERD